MKKQFQILSTAITILLYSCGIQNAEIRGTIKNEVKELSTNSSSLSNEPDLLMIDSEGRLRFNGDPRDHTKKLHYRPSARSVSYTIDRSELAKTRFRLKMPYGVN